MTTILIVALGLVVVVAITIGAVRLLVRHEHMLVEGSKLAGLLFDKVVRQNPNYRNTLEFKAHHRFGLERHGVRWDITNVIVIRVTTKTKTPNICIVCEFVKDAAKQWSLENHPQFIVRIK